MVAIALVALATIAVLGLSIPNQAAVASKIQSINSQRLAEISLSLRRFAVRYGRLPCPAGITFLATNVLYGIEAGNPGGPGNCVPGGGVSKVSNTVIGAVPWVTLGLPAEKSLDAYGHRIEYMVLESATGASIDTIPFLTGEIKSYSGTPTSNGAAKAGTGQNQLNACSTTPLDNSCNQLGIFALLSRGANAFGAYTDSGAQLPLPPAPQQPQYPGEMENLNGDLAFVSQTGLQRDTFDDMIVVQASEDFIVAVYQELSLPLPTAEKITDDRLKKAFAAILGKTISQRNQDAPATTKYGTSNCNSLIGAGTVCAIGITPDVNGDGTITVVSDAFAGTRQWQSGYLPYLDLGIPLAQTYDGWGRLLIYGVNSDMVAGSTAIPPRTSRGISSQGTAGRPRVMTTFGIVPYITAAQSDMAYEVRSKGADGVAGTADDIYLQVRIGALVSYFANAGQPLP